MTERMGVTNSNRRRGIVLCLVMSLALMMTLTVTVSTAGASSHPSYPLGHAKACKSHYVKRTARHQVSGRSVRYVVCVYVSPPTPTSTTTTTTTTTTTPPITASFTISVLDPNLLDDALAFSFNGLPSPPDVDALPGDPVYLLGFVTDPLTDTPSGSMTFTVNGVPVPSCEGIEVENDGASPAKSEGQCSYEFSISGPVTVGVTFQGADGSAGTAEKTFSVATPDEVQIIDNECLLVTFGSC